MSGIRADVAGDLAKEIMGRPDAHVASWEMLDIARDGIDAVRIKLCDAPLLKTGPNAGRPNWRRSSNVQSRIILMDELKMLAAAWSERTGKCLDCAGTGQLFVRWSTTEGTTWRRCPACEGTGQRRSEVVP